jgi:hypothetical protein
MACHHPQADFLNCKLTLLTPTGTGLHGAIARHDEGGASPEMVRTHNGGAAKEIKLGTPFVEVQPKKVASLRGREASCFVGSVGGLIAGRQEVKIL